MEENDHGYLSYYYILYYNISYYYILYYYILYYYRLSYRLDITCLHVFTNYNDYINYKTSCSASFLKLLKTGRARWGRR